MLTQRRWRIAGVLLLAVSGAMAYFGVSIDALYTSRATFGVYWGVFLLVFIGAVYCALLDLRYIRVHMAIEERELYRQTLGDEAFRKALRQAQEEESAKRGHTKPGGNS